MNKVKPKLCTRCSNNHFVGGIEDDKMIFKCIRCGAVWMIWNPDTLLRDFSDYFTKCKIGIGFGAIPIKQFPEG